MDKSWLFTDPSKNKRVRGLIFVFSLVVLITGIVAGVKTGRNIFTFVGIGFALFDLTILMTTTNLEKAGITGTHMIFNKTAVPLNTMRTMTLKNRTISFTSAGSKGTYHYDGSPEQKQGLDQIIEILPEICDVSIEDKRK